MWLHPAGRTRYHWLVWIVPPGSDTLVLFPPAGWLTDVYRLPSWTVLVAVLVAVPGALTRSQRAGFHQVLQVGEIGFQRSLGKVLDERLRQLEEATWLRLQGETDPCAPRNGLVGLPDFNCNRPPFAFLHAGPVRLVGGDCHFAFKPLAERLLHNVPGGAHANR